MGIDFGSCFCDLQFSIKKKCDNSDIGLGHLKYGHNVQQVGNLNRNNMYFFSVIFQAQESCGKWLTIVYLWERINKEMSWISELFLITFKPTSQHWSWKISKSSRKRSAKMNPLHPRSDKHLISPYNITPESHIKVMRIKKMITN